MNWPKECAVVVPCLNEEAFIGPVVESVRQRLPGVIVVDDGSSDATSSIATKAGAEVLRHETPRGKGAALNTGWRRAMDRGFSWALTMDGDGQHSPEDIPGFLAAAEDGKAGMVVGNRMADVRAMPWLRRQTNRWMSRRLSKAAGVPLPDTQCGFRLMNLAAWKGLSIQAEHFEIESELLLAFAGAGHAIRFVPIKTIYRDEKSKINPLRDTVRWFRWWRQTGAAKRVRRGERS